MQEKIYRVYEQSWCNLKKLPRYRWKIEDKYYEVPQTYESLDLAITAIKTLEKYQDGQFVIINMRNHKIVYVTGV